MVVGQHVPEALTVTDGSRVVVNWSVADQRIVEALMIAFAFMRH